MVYQPPHFREERLEVQHALMRAHPFGILVTRGPDGAVADHIPFELDATAGLGTLRAHVARANPLWRAHGEGPALAIFSGPEHYITPAWYETKRETGKVVPTWNYAIVHAHGPFRVVEDEAWLRAHVGRLTDRFEADRAEPWAVDDAPADFLRAQLRGIVGIEIEIARIEAKWKVSQNRPEADRRGVVDGLRAADDADAAAMAALVEAARRG